MKKIVFTICSNNYLAHAATLMQSWFSQHDDTLGYVFLVDELTPAVDYSIVSPAAVVAIKDVRIDCFNKLVEQYNITELNTAVKPDVFMHLFSKHPGAKVVYLDPDILIEGQFDEVFDGLKENDFVLTPHIMRPVDDDKAPTDHQTMRTGIFNLGFIALKDTSQIAEFLLWWRARVYKYGYCDLTANLFYDQLWTNLIPVFYEKYLILKHPGYNMANWNLHERTLSKGVSNEWMVNGQDPLKFFHFSGYKFTKPTSIGSYHTRYNFAGRPDLHPIFKKYQQYLIGNGAEQLSCVPCVYFEQHKRLKAIALAEKEAVIAAATPIRAKILRKVAAVMRRIVYS